MIPSDTKNPFKNTMGTRYLKGLFYETTLQDKSSVVYTLKDQDHLGYVSLYRLYTEADDPTEYKFATQHLDGWEHWEALCQCSWFKPYLDRWRRELETRLRARALLEIRAVANDPDHPSSYHANKYLLDGSWKPTGESKRGRPTKEAIKKEAALQASNEQQITSDFERIIARTN
jgi:hypothetical protein